jgi:hypothetical protein
MRNLMQKEETCTLSGIVAGCVGGFVATWIMSAAQNTAVTVADELETRQAARSPAEAATVAAGAGRGSGVIENAEEGQRAAKRLVNRAADLAGVDLASDETTLGAGFVPFAFGTFVGGLYGGLAEHFPLVTVGNGALYGAAVWLGAEEFALPALELTRPSLEAPVSSHATGLLSHLVYGNTLETVRRLVRALLW